MIDRPEDILSRLRSFQRDVRDATITSRTSAWKATSRSTAS